MKIYITYDRESFTKEQIDSLSKIGDLIFLEEFFGLGNAPYLNDDNDKILMVDPDWYNWNISSEHLSKIKNLKAVCLSTTAYDWIDLEYCKENNIIVCNIPKYSTDSVAEYGIFLMMCLARKLTIQIQNDYKVDYTKPMLHSELKGKTVGIIGLGSIGSRIAEICTNLGMNVIYYNRSEKVNNYKRVELEEIFKDADYIFPTFRTNDETKKLITDELINLMDGNSLINIITNPNDIYNHNLVLEKASKNEISYAFEIYGNMPKSYKGNVMAVAPYAFYTKEAIDRLISIWVFNTISVLSGDIKNNL